MNGMFFGTASRLGNERYLKTGKNVTTEVLRFGVTFTENQRDKGGVPLRGRHQAGQTGPAIFES